jgi:hypothetical protein
MFTAVGGSSKLVDWIKPAVLTGIELKVFAPPSDACDIQAFRGPDKEDEEPRSE